MPRATAPSAAGLRSKGEFAQRPEQLDAARPFAQVLAEDVRHDARVLRDVLGRRDGVERRREPVRDLARPVAVVVPRGLEEGVERHRCAPRCGAARQQRRASLEARLRPVRVAVVVLVRRGHAGRDHDPRLLRHREDVDVGRQAVGLVERADAHETHRVAGARIVAPDRDAAMRAAADLLSPAALGRRRHHVDFAMGELHAVGLDHRVQRVRGSGLALAPAAVAAVDEQRRGRHPVAHVATRASAVEGPEVLGGHGPAILARVRGVVKPAAAPTTGPRAPARRRIRRRRRAGR